MYSTVQAVFVLDLSNFVNLCSSESEIEHHIAKIKLVSLKLLLNFGAKTERALEGVRWSWKFYDSRTFRPDTSRRQFLDFGKKAFGEFEAELTDKYCKVFDNQQEECEQSGCRQPHSFVLKKALQEVLLDYNWDGPDISSPVKTNRRKNGNVGPVVPPASGGTYNAVVVVANVPRDSEASCEGSPEDFLANVLDAAMVKAFQEDKKISLSLLDLWEDASCPLPSKLNTELAKLGGSLHSITNFIQTQPKQVAKTQALSASIPECGQNGIAVSSQQVQLPWRSARNSRPRKPQPGPTLVWEDTAGISHLSIQLQVLAVYGSCSRAWGTAAVVGVVQTNQVALLALAQETASLYMCVAASETFGAIVTVLATHQLSLMLRLSGGSLALLSPWGEGAGCLALVSTSGLAALAPDMPDCPPSTLQFVSAAVRKCLKNAAPHTEQESTSSKRWFSASMVQSWFRPISYPALPTLRARNKLAPHRRAMLERLQKRYRPQIPQPLATGETGPLDLVDITQPPGESQSSQATLAKPTMTRAQQLLKKSHIVTAQQRVKEQLAEEEERVQATERRAAQACERALKSQALETQVLNTVSDPQDERELVQSLMDLRETAGMEADIFTTAQTIINLALVHVKNTVTATPAATTMQELLGAGRDEDWNGAECLKLSYLLSILYKIISK
ncbi:Treslin [Portunus trituberculatus]|uniref:Treslin n=1 Tax=Portunus trituberculatus TaxID=210409 RepID=A0A5B7CF52_PORTR|nr:Treslin [Portunus trituberculatus]